MKVATRALFPDVVHVNVAGVLYTSITLLPLRVEHHPAAIVPASVVIADGLVSALVFAVNGNVIVNVDKLDVPFPVRMFTVHILPFRE